MTRGTFVAAGEALVDIVVPHDGEALSAPGGSPLNVAVGLSRLGLDALLLTQIGDDERAALIRAHLDAQRRTPGPGVGRCPASPPAPRPPGSTSTARRPTSSSSSGRCRPRRCPPTPSGCTSAPSASRCRRVARSVMGLVEQARDRDLLVTFDPNARPAFTPDADRAWADVRETASYARLVKMSDEDLAFYRPGATPRRSPASCSARRRAWWSSPSGGHGAVAFSADHAVEVAGRTTVGRRHRRRRRLLHGRPGDRGRTSTASTTSVPRPCGPCWRPPTRSPPSRSRDAAPTRRGATSSPRAGPTAPERVDTGRLSRRRGGDGVDPGPATHRLGPGVDLRAPSRRPGRRRSGPAPCRSGWCGPRPPARPGRCRPASR